MNDEKQISNQKFQTVARRAVNNAVTCCIPRDRELIFPTMNTLARRGELSTAKEERLSNGLVVHVVKKIFDVDGVSDWFPPKSGGSTMRDVQTGDIVSIAEPGSPEPLPAIAPGVIEKQIVHASQRYQSAMVFDLGDGAENHRGSGCRKGSDLWIRRSNS
jgi:hypothetical protein